MDLNTTNNGYAAKIDVGRQMDDNPRAVTDNVPRVQPGPNPSTGPRPQPPKGNNPGTKPDPKEKPDPRRKTDGRAVRGAETFVF